MECGALNGTTMSSSTELVKPERVVIKRSKWVGGECEASFGWAMLLQPPDAVMRGVDNEARMCCMGFYCKAAGMSDEQIHGHYSPYTTGFLVPSLVDLVNGDLVDTEVCVKMQKVNDDHSVPDTAREQQLIELAASIGVEFVFED